ncbi:Xaa-Pro aminopeptidase [Acaryochloris thomasi RCC1774]|uniref:Xaa-Pro aminopeptidase n=1 Tax=Acaryochloris thomasi RCC1774 TaxID=1764569 RepID=A0A2W1JH83_9CYAN|nr:aminopeptidase P family protein [Acaryochloris thomasi]PZD70955.1 Xaa-Pro aminopeptidase [Acaryochloris thomasi RCC1774]
MNPSDPRVVLQQRREKLAQHFCGPAILWSGSESPRNFPANRFPFRASSHFLFFAGRSLANAAIHLEAGKLTLFMDDADANDALWHGPSPRRQEIAKQMGADQDYPLSKLASWTQDVATIPVQDSATRQIQEKQIGRTLGSAKQLQGHNRQLAKAIVAVRMIHDQSAISSIREAAAVTVKAHLAGMTATYNAQTEAEIRAAMEAVIMAHNLTCAYNSIVTVQGEVLHNQSYHRPIRAGDLLLADVGAEKEGWASDVTRTWPISGSFSSTQHDIYDIVLAAHDICIAKAAPGVEFRDLHLLAALTLAEGLVSLGILKGKAETLVERDAHALFFPHGVGHLLGLDVHDMEDLGDLAGYAPGRKRCDRFGLGFLRLDRPLQKSMIVTIEPGFYQVPSLLKNPERQSHYQDCINWDQLVKFKDVQGIRIEDDILITAKGAEVLTAALPSVPSQIESYMNRCI